MSCQGPDSISSSIGSSLKARKASEFKPRITDPNPCMIEKTVSTSLKEEPCSLSALSYKATYLLRHLYHVSCKTVFPQFSISRLSRV